MGPDAIDEALRQARGGNPDAYGVVVAAYQARVRSFLAGYVPQAQWVDDLAQQAFVSAYQGLKHFQPGTDFYAWLRQIAYNHLRAELERASRRRRLEKDYLAGLCAGELSRRLERGSRVDDDLDALRDCVSRLPEVSRDIVRRHYEDGRPLAEIAGRLGRTAESLKVSLFRIRTGLRECVEHKRASLETGSAS